MLTHASIWPLQTSGPALHAPLRSISWPLRDTAKDQRKADEALLKRMFMGEGHDFLTWGKREKSPYSQVIISVVNSLNIGKIVNYRTVYN